MSVLFVFVPAVFRLFQLAGVSSSNAAEIRGCPAAPVGIHLRILKNVKLPPICEFLAVYNKLPKLPLVNPNALNWRHLTQKESIFEYRAASRTQIGYNRS
jgi:hypothetical protein